MTTEVKKYLNQYIVAGRHSSARLIGRSLYYFPLFETKINEKALPAELKYLAIIESSLKPHARSRVGAVGLWQFMRATGRMYGLTINNVVDERKDPEKSTEAALNYLSDLYDRFDDWTLALAAYNCGPGNVNKAMRKSGGKDYWSIRNYLPRETRNYVPKFIAMAYLMNYYMDHQIEPDYPEELFTKTRKAVTLNKLSFQEISHNTGLEMDVISWYNPSYVGHYIPQSELGNVLILPANEMYSFIEKKSTDLALVPDPFQDFVQDTNESQQKMEKREYMNLYLLPSIAVKAINNNKQQFQSEMSLTVSKGMAYKVETAVEKKYKKAKFSNVFRHLQKRKLLVRKTVVALRTN
jgi:membrane-bound lytic murein transglycosylase D